MFTNKHKASLPIKGLSIISLNWRHTMLQCWNNLYEVLWAEGILEEVLGPNDAVDGFGGSVTDGAARESLLRGFGLTLVALCHPLQEKKKRKQSQKYTMPSCSCRCENLVQPSSHLLDDGDLTEISRRPAFDQGNIRCQTHPVHVIPGRWRRQTNRVSANDKQEAFAHTALKMRKFAYLGYPERSWPAETSWRIRRCSLD